MLNMCSEKGRLQDNSLVNKTNLAPCNKQSGFTLVVVLILSGLASILVLNSLKDNVNQERLSGNFQKKINARLTSERGIFDTIQAAELVISQNGISTLAGLLGALGPTNELEIDGKTYRVDISDDGTGDLLLESVGNMFEGQSTLKVRLKFNPGTTISTGGYAGFSDAVVGCEGVALEGSGKVDSYNSNDGDYNEATASSEGDVSTIDHNGADVILTGGATIRGDIQATGIVDIGTTCVDGNIHANGDVTIGNCGLTNDVSVIDPINGSIKPVNVSGNVLTRGNYSQIGRFIGGYVKANGDAYIKDNGITNSIVNVDNNPYDIQYGGTGTFGGTKHSYRDSSVLYSNYDSSLYVEVPLVKSDDDDETAYPDYDPLDPETNCDHLDVASIVDEINDTNASLPDFNEGNSGDINSFALTPTKLTMDHQQTGMSQLFTATTKDVLGNEQSAIMVDDFILTRPMTVSGGDVTLYVEGDFIVEQGAGILTITEGSSLTLLVKGKVIVRGGGNIIALQHGLADAPNSLPAMSIYSSYVSNASESIYDYNGRGISIKSSSDIYAQVYAPLAYVDITADGGFFGAVRGKEVTVTGDAGVHYDAALGEGNRGGSDSSTTTTTTGGFSFLGFEY